MPYFFLRSDLTTQDRILKIRVLASLGTLCIQLEKEHTNILQMYSLRRGIGVGVKGVAGSDAIVAQ